MKLQILILALMAAATFSCSKEGVVSNGSSSCIDFSTLLTRGSVISDPLGLAQAGGFSVWAYNHTGSWSTNPAKAPLLENETVTSADGNDWSYGPPVYWLNDNHVSFFAYAPAGSAIVNGATPLGVPVIDFTVASNPLNQKDLTIATQQYDQFGPYYANNKPVNLFFNHALSMVRFSALTTGGIIEEVKVKKVVLKNIYYAGSTSLQAPVNWTIDTFAVNDYTLEAAKGLKDIALTTASQDISSDNGLLFLLPQTIDRSSDDIEMTVTLTIGDVEVSYTSPLFSPMAWVAGRAYNYQIAVDKSSIQVIVIDSDITLQAATTSATTQSIILSPNQAKDIANLYAGVSILNNLNGSALTPGCMYFGVYGTYDLDHDLTIDIYAASTGAFTTAQYLIFDFKKTLGIWGRDAFNNPWTVKVINYSDDWELAPSFQTDVDAMSGATRQTPSDVMQNRGSIILKRK